VLAFALASLVLGGTGGAVLGAVSDGGDDSAGPGGFGGRGQLVAPNGAPGGQPGQQQGTTGAPVTGSLGGSAG
jgi:hypothetical protein